MSLSKELEKIAEIYKKPAKNFSFKYSSYPELILAEGFQFSKIASNQSEHTHPRYCYYNCYTVAINNPKREFFYCEGYAMKKELQIPIEHAWLVNSSFEVIEITWDCNEAEYYGFVFQTDWLRNFIENRKLESYSLFADNYLENFLFLNGVPAEAIVTPV